MVRVAFQEDSNMMWELEAGLGANSLVFGPTTSQLILITSLGLRQFSSVQLLSCVRLFATPWTAARQASLSITNSRSSLKLMSIK